MTNSEHNNKDQLILLYGGRSGEHEISMISAGYVYRTLDKEKYDVTPIWINHSGRWFLTDKKTLSEYKNENGALPRGSIPCALRHSENGAPVLSTDSGETRIVNFAFNLLHGTYGEDGRMQGFLDTLGIPSSGSGVAGSVLNINKIVTKKILKASGIPQVNFEGMTKEQYQNSPEQSIEWIEKNLRYPIFTKPVSLGSSVGISKCKNREELKNGIENAFDFDNQIILEEGKRVRELEAAVLGNLENIRISEVGEIIVKSEFYSYDAKYSDPDAAQLQIPAIIPPKLKAEMEELIRKTCFLLQCEGYARVDLFFDENEERLYFNEINTIPGFTMASMFPRLWRAAGMKDSEVIDEIVRLGYERFQKNARLNYEYQGAVQI